MTVPTRIRYSLYKLNKYSGRGDIPTITVNTPVVFSEFFHTNLHWQGYEFGSLDPQEPNEKKLNYE